jgi:hypothetical protein
MGLDARSTCSLCASGDKCVLAAAGAFLEGEDPHSVSLFELARTLPLHNIMTDGCRIALCHLLVCTVCQYISVFGRNQGLASAHKLRLAALAKT